MKLLPVLVILLGSSLTALGAENKSPAKPEEKKAAPIPAAKATEPAAEPKKADAAQTVVNAAPEPATPLPTVEVNKKRGVTVLEHQLHEKDKEIAREKKNAKVGEIDGALNSPTINPTILGGASGKVRAGLAQERVELMEFEKDLTEQIARAKTKEEKAMLKKQLADIRTVRRNLDQPQSEPRR